ncbi:hypothetical protein FVER14953_21645 [Fusarium verticillioides]|nr:hypothetical protein FVER14953_21645 [Fusarium verticillioides]
MITGRCYRCDPLAKQDIVFHVQADFTIAYWSSKKQDENLREQYDTANLKVSGNYIKVNPELPILAAVAYENSGQDVVRVFYVGQDFYLRELRRVGEPGSKWYDGESLNSKEWDIDSKSGLTANIVKTGSMAQLKVFYQKKPNKLSVAYSVLNFVQDWEARDDWSNRANVTN